MKNKAENTGSKRAWDLLQRVVPITLGRRFNYSADPVEIDGPFLLIANHVTNFDPFFVGLAYKKAPLCFVASEHIFRLGSVSRMIERLLAPIPRSKGSSGVSTVKSCLKRLHAGAPVALFAEGDCTWDGVTHGIFPATGKLAKAAGVPLVTFRLEGGYLSHPRWAKKSRRGRMHGGPVRIYSAEELAAMTSAEVTDAINRDIFTDAWEDQRSDPVPYACSRRAEGLERGFFVCPECGKVASIASKGNTAYCRTCGMRAEFDEYGFFSNGRPFETLLEWERFQWETLRGLVGNGSADPLAAIEGRLIRVGESGSKRGVRTRLCVLPGQGALMIGDRDLPFETIENMSMVKTNRLLFTCDDGYYEFKCKKGALRPALLLWQAAKSANREET